MNELIEKNIEIIKNYCAQHDVEKLYAFGSVISDNLTDKSDIDLLIKFKEIPCDLYTDNYFNLHKLFERVFKRKVDLLTENSLSNPFFIKKINETKRLLYEG
jgi:uncharacterized protein